MDSRDQQWQQVRLGLFYAPAVLFTEEPRSMSGSLPVTTPTNICVFVYSDPAIKRQRPVDRFLFVELDGSSQTRGGLLHKPCGPGTFAAGSKCRPRCSSARLKL